MDVAQLFAWFVAGLIVLKGVVEFILDRLNRRHVLRRTDRIPSPYDQILDEATYRKSVDYTLAKNRLSQTEICFDTAWLLIVLFSGLLPWGYLATVSLLGQSTAGLALFLLFTAVVLSLPGLPFSWYAQFHLEERFGFNTTTPKLWVADRVKGLLLLFLLGFPLLWLILKIAGWTGGWWWFWAWTIILGFQLLMMVLAPIFILPLFNKFTPLPPGPLKERLMDLAHRTEFQARGIQVMDGSKRSTHSNAFFTGFGRWRKIVLFDTLVEQLSPDELESVLAHEIGHYKKKHIPKLLAGSAAGMLAGFFILGWLAQQPWFYHAFGFDTAPLAVALLLFGLLSGAVTFWLSPLTNSWARRYEYQADAYAAQTVGTTESLKSALRKLTQKNLSNLTPHPLYSGFYYSHPTLQEREQALG